MSRGCEGPHKLKKYSLIQAAIFFGGVDAVQLNLQIIDHLVECDVKNATNKYGENALFNASELSSFTRYEIDSDGVEWPVTTIYDVHDPDNHILSRLLELGIK